MKSIVMKITEIFDILKMHIGSFVLTYLFDSDLNQENFNDFWMKWLAKNGLKILQWEESFLLCKKDLESFFCVWIYKVELHNCWTLDDCASSKARV